MRLWSIHPGYLDSKGLVALWREALLAQSVLRGRTKGYKNHPQLARFKKAEDPRSAIANYLVHVADEADKRGYHFNREKIATNGGCRKMQVTEGQVDYELGHLLNKLKVRDPMRHEELRSHGEIRTHPLFVKMEGEIEEWEIIHPEEP